MIMPTALVTWHRALTHQLSWGWAVFEKHKPGESFRKLPAARLLFDVIQERGYMEREELMEVVHEIGSETFAYLDSLDLLDKAGIIELKLRLTPTGLRKFVSLKLLKKLSYKEYLGLRHVIPIDQRKACAIEKAKVKGKLVKGQLISVADMDFTTYQKKRHHITRLLVLGVLEMVGMVDVGEVRKVAMYRVTEDT